MRMWHPTWHQILQNCRGRQICTIRMKLFSLHYHIGRGEGWEWNIPLPPSMPPSPHKHHNVNFVSATMFSGAAPAMATHFIRDNSFERLNWTFSWLFHVITTVFASFESTHKITIAEGWVDVAGVPACSHSHSCLMDKNVCPDNWYLEPIVFPMFPPPPCLHPSTGLEL